MNRNESSVDDDCKSGDGSRAKYNLRTKSIQNRIEVERRKSEPRHPKPKQKPAPLSKYRRRTANFRERCRMQEMNNAFKRLQSVVPGQVVPEDTTATDKADQSSKLSKINTLKLAVNYISALTQILKQTDGEKHRFSRSTTTIINPVTPAKCHLNSSPSIVTSGEQNRPTVRYKCEPVPSRRPDDNFEYQQQQQQHYHRPYDYQQAKSFAPPSAYNPYQASSTTTPSIVDYDSTTAAMSTATTHTSDTNLDNILLDFDAFFDDFDSENLTMLMN